MGGPTAIGERGVFELCESPRERLEGFVGESDATLEKKVLLDVEDKKGHLCVAELPCFGFDPLPPSRRERFSPPPAGGVEDFPTLWGAESIPFRFIVR